MSGSQTKIAPGRYDEIPAICDFVAVGAEAAGFDADVIFRLTLACDEACTNVIEHGYGGENRGDIRVSYTVENDTFVITIVDFGQPFNPDDVATPQIPDGSNLDNLQVGGLGIHIMRKVMDQIAYQFDAQRGNTLTMVKSLEGGA